MKVHGRLIWNLQTLCLRANQEEHNLTIFYYCKMFSTNNLNRLLISYVNEYIVAICFISLQRSFFRWNKKVFKCYSLAVIFLCLHHIFCLPSIPYLVLSASVSLSDVKKISANLKNVSWLQIAKESCMCGKIFSHALVKIPLPILITLPMMKVLSVVNVNAK